MCFLGKHQSIFTFRKNPNPSVFSPKIVFSITQIVGNLLYYRYMNPAIVAPDGFDIIDMTAGGQINSDQRRNLGTVAKVLQHAASNKLFEGENEHLASTNNYLSETYQKFRWEGVILEKLAKWCKGIMYVLCSDLELGGRNLRWLLALL